MKESKTHAWITFIGVILFLVGVYAAVRTGINLTLFDKYPQTGVITLNFSGTPPYYQREQDCSYPRAYYSADGRITRQPTLEEKEQEKRDTQSCLEGVAEARQTAKINDISQSLLLLFLGVGVLVARKIFFK